jgi:glycosyltransferase involved in cell wall biosynthesis
MKFKIITPTYMQGRFIEKTIISVAEQTYKNYVHIIIDNNSTDETKSIVDHYLKLNNKIIYLRGKDTGPAQAINKGLEYCDTDLVCWINSDDEFFDNNVLQIIVKKFIEDPKIEIVTGNGYYINENGRNISPIVTDYIKSNKIDTIQRYCNILQPSTFWRQSDIRLDESLKYCFDWDLWLKFQQANKNFVQVNEYLSKYRVHADSLTHMDGSKRRFEIYLMVKKYGQNKSIVIWCFFIFLMFLSSEKLNISILKVIALKLNNIVFRISNKKIVSC